MAMKQNADGKFTITHGRSRTGTYAIWGNMLYRCNTPTATGYQNYGGRGIRVCERWHDFSNFLADMGERPAGQWIERIDNDGNYEPGNCQWASPKVQAYNRRNTRIVDGMTTIELAKAAGLSHANVKQRLARGWTADRIMTQPRRKYPETVHA